MTTQYLDLLKTILRRGVQKGDRTGTGTISLFGHQMRFDLDEGFPLLTTKKIGFRLVAEELIWMLSGSTNEHTLRDKNVNIWSEWATAEQCARFGRKAGDLGPVYGHQWRNFGATERTGVTGHIRKELLETGYAGDGFDQIAKVIDQLRNNPDSRRIILTGWNPKEADQVALPPCHTLAQFYVADGKLSTQLYQRSADVFLGVPFNIACYALLTHMLAQVAGLQVGEFVHTFGDVHIYNNHVDQVAEQLRRQRRPLPTLVLDNTVKEIGDFEWRHIEMRNYNPHPAIKGEVSV